MKLLLFSDVGALPLRRVDCRVLPCQAVPVAADGFLQYSSEDIELPYLSSDWPRSDTDNNLPASPSVQHGLISPVYVSFLDNKKSLPSFTQLLGMKNLTSKWVRPMAQHHWAPGLTPAQGVQFCPCFLLDLSCTHSLDVFLKVSQPAHGKDELSVNPLTINPENQFGFKEFPLGRPLWSRSPESWFGKNHNRGFGGCCKTWYEDTFYNLLCKFIISLLNANVHKESRKSHEDSLAWAEFHVCLTHRWF